MNLKALILTLFIFAPIFGYPQDKMKALSKIGIGINLGYKTYNGIGPMFLWHPNRLFDFEAGVGYSAYNGAKFGGGLKLYPFKSGGKVLPFFGLHYAVTSGQYLKTAKVVDISLENYRTFPNQYLIGTFGIWISGEQIQHQFSVGYAGLLKPYKIVADSTNKLSDHKEEIVRGLKGGISFTYTLYINLNKLSE